jgi:hypothetical protein
MKSKSKKPSKRARRDAELGVATRLLRLRVKAKHAAVLKVQNNWVTGLLDIRQEALRAKGKSMSVEPRADEVDVNKDSGEKLSVAGYQVSRSRQGR